jgi:hypothetical protein
MHFNFNLKARIVMQSISNHFGRQAIVAAVFASIASLSQAGVASSSVEQNASIRMDSTAPSRPSINAVDSGTSKVLGPYAKYLVNLGMNAEQAEREARFIDAKSSSVATGANGAGKSVRSDVKQAAPGPYAAYLIHVVGIREQDAVEAARSIDGRQATARIKTTSDSESQAHATSKASRSVSTPGGI